MKNSNGYFYRVARSDYRQLLPRLLVASLLCLGAVTIANAAAGPGGIVQGVFEYPDFKAPPLDPTTGYPGYLNDLADPVGDAYPPYVQTFDFPVVDDPVHTPGIPGVSVYLKNTVSGAVTASVVTDSKGVFVFPSQAAGIYAVCWSSGVPGLLPGCADDIDTFNTFEVIDFVSNRWVTNLGGSNHIDWLPLDDPLNNILAFEGYVTAPNLPNPYVPNLNVACSHNDPFFQQDETAIVQLKNSANVVLATVKANSLGRYLITTSAPVVPSNYKLVASCGTNRKTLSFNLVSQGRYFENLILPNNTPPTITSLAASSSTDQGSIPAGTPLAGVPLGTAINAAVQATDSNGNALSYVWRSTAGAVKATGNTAVWTLPATGKGLHFLYVDVNDKKGGHKSSRITLSTDAGFLAATPTTSVQKPADFYPESDRFLTYRGIDTKISACQYYKAIGAVKDCSPAGALMGGITFKQWLVKFGLKAPPSPYSATPPLNPNEFHAQFRNVADLDLIRNHHGRNTSPDVNGQDHVGYYVCNHFKATGATPDSNLVACVNMEYSVTPGQNDGKPFTKFLTFGPTGQLIASVNLDGRGEKYTPGNCVPCHGGDNYFSHFPASGAGAHDGNIGSYFVPFDLDNFDYDAPYTRVAQEDSVRNLNLGLNIGEMLAPAGKEIVDGWYPGSIGLQQSNFLPKGWDSAQTPTVPVLGVNSTFSGADLYEKVVKPSCRGCHLSMGAPLGLDFHSYDYDGTPGDFVGGNALIPRTQLNDLHTSQVICEKYNDGLPIYNTLEDINSPAKTMPNAIQTFNRYWNDPVQTDLMQNYLTARNGSTVCNVPGQ
jgi:hypothetical protein